MYKYRRTRYPVRQDSSEEKVCPVLQDSNKSSGQNGLSRSLHVLFFGGSHPLGQGIDQRAPRFVEEEHH